MKQVTFNEDGTITVDGKVFIEAKAVEKNKSSVVILEDIITKENKSIYYISESNEILSCKNLNYLTKNHLPTERDAKRVQAYIALINCAKYFNGDWNGGGNYWLISNDGEIKELFSREKYANEVRFKSKEAAQSAVEVLKNEGLFEYLF